MPDLSVNSPKRMAPISKRRRISVSCAPVAVTRHLPQDGRGGRGRDPGAAVIGRPTTR